MPAPVILYIDTTNKAQVASFLTSQQPGSQTDLEAGDLVPFQLHFLQKNSTATASSSTLQQLPYSYIDPATVTPVSMAIGALGAVPTAGTFTVTFGANTTPAQAFNVAASTLQTALNALASVTTAGGVVVTGNAGGPYRIAFNTVGAQTLFAIGATNLSPTSLGITARAVAGTGSFAEVQVLRLVQSPAALQNSWTATYGAISITRLQAGGSGLNEIQRVTVPQGTYAGGFSLAFGAAGTGSQAYNVTASALQTALQALSTIGANNATVIQSSTVTWDITFTGTLAGVSQSLIVANGVGLQMPQYLSANIDLNVEGVFDLLFAAGANSASAVLQVQQGSTVNTVLQVPVTINNTLIQGTPSVPNPVDPWQTLSQVSALIAGAAYVLPNATTTTKGGVIVPTAGNLAVDGSGNISVPVATTTVLGVVKPDNATIANAAGVLTARTATTALLGIVKPSGTSITVTAGAIDTAQDIRSSASPSFAGLTLSSGNLAFSTGGRGIVGTATNNNADAGNVGEAVTSKVLVGSAVSLTTNVVSNVTSISLTAGDWDITGTVGLSQGGSTVSSYLVAGIGSTSATYPGNDSGQVVVFSGQMATTTDPVFNTPNFRVSIASTTIFYLVAKAGFTTSTMSAYGTLVARRRR